MSAFPAPRRISLPDRVGPRGAKVPAITLAVYERGSGPAVVMSHGFPELAYSWRHQLAALADGGFRAIAVDQRGYGESDCPGPIEDYDLEHLATDMAAVLDALGIEKAYFAGHDWGGFVAWAMPVLHPERTLGVIGVNTPNFPFPTTKFYRTLVDADDKLYILWFQQPGVAERFMDRDPRIVFEKLMRRAVPREQAMLQAASDGVFANPFLHIQKFTALGEALLNPEELDVYVRAYTKTGFRGGINWYRNIDRNAERLPDVGTTKLDLPCLMVTTDRDPAFTPETSAHMPQICSNLEVRMIEPCGHWTQQEQPEQLNRAMLDWLRRR